MKIICVCRNATIVLLLVMACAMTGCATVQTRATSGDFGQAAPTVSMKGPGAGTSPGEGASPLGGAGYTWVEYRMTAGSGGPSQMIVYYKYNQKTGKCTMRFETTQKMEGLPSEMDCTFSGSSGSQVSGDPNRVNTDVGFVKTGTETVTVPAGTFDAEKYTVTYQGKNTATYWIASGKPLVKMESGDAKSRVMMELNGWG